jgi:hypothetical protein
LARRSPEGEGGCIAAARRLLFCTNDETLRENCGQFRPHRDIPGATNTKPIE